MPAHCTAAGLQKFWSHNLSIGQTTQLISCSYLVVCMESFFFFLRIVLFWVFLYLLMKVKYRGDGNSQVFHNWKVFVCTPELLVDAVTAPQASEQTVSEDLLGTKRHFTLCARHLKQDQMSKSDCVWSGFMMTFISLGKNLCVVLVTNPKACVKSTSISNV